MWISSISGEYSIKELDPKAAVFSTCISMLPLIGGNEDEGISHKMAEEQQSATTPRE
jgi:hypothetical protein